MNKKQNVVFFIGAGFSAPFGLPVMSNFVDKARDLYFFDKDKYSVLGSTLELIQKFSTIKNHLRIDLHNIEDLLSIAYMESTVNKRSKSFKLITEFIKTTITAYTKDPSNADLLLNHFAKVIANVQLESTNYSVGHAPNEHKQQVYKGKREEHTDYSIISLNYDNIIENALCQVAKNAGKYYNATDSKDPNEKYYKTTNCLEQTGVKMVKLHGSLEREIIPPIWNKNVIPGVKKDWETASILLSEVTHLYFLGYSLPPTDNYIRYLLANSLRTNQKLKKVSVITKDSDGKTLQRYLDLFSARTITHNCDIREFLNSLRTVKEHDYDELDDIFQKYLQEKHLV